VATPLILLTHTPEMRRSYYGDRALAGLRQLGTVRLHEADDPLDAEGLVRAGAGAQIVVSDRNTPGHGEIFGRLPDLVAFLRVAVDIRNIDVSAASRAGVLVTHAGRSWVPAVTELVIGHMIGIARRIPDAVVAYRKGEAAAAVMGSQLHGSVAGIVGYGPLGRNVAQLLLAFGMTVLVNDPYVKIDRAGIEQVSLVELVQRADFVLPLAVATMETENLIGEAELRAMKPTAYLVNLSRGNLIDEIALGRALDERWITGAAMDVGRAPDQMP
jgi:D-3-phosphoglycerate dehydrogenase